LASGTSEEIAQNEEVKQNYLGDDFVFWEIAWN
jgi:ABC-type lipopolysaccharide export system ATPase subunit